MNDQKIETMFEQANRLINSAQEELCRPEEDVVPYLVCRNAFLSVNKYLIGYLLMHEIDHNATMSLEILLEQCRAIDPKFNNLNLDSLYNANIHEYDDVWMDMNTVGEFIDLAKQTKNMVSQS